MSLPSGPILPNSDILNSFEFGPFVLSNLAARRAKQIKEGAAPLVRCESTHPLTIALAEIAAGKIKPIVGKEEPMIAIVEDGAPELSSDIAGEFGILLPALDASEAELEGVGALTADEHESDHDHDDELEGAPAPSLSDLLDDHETEPESPAPASDEDTLSLTDIAEQESMDAEDEELPE